MPIIRSTIFTDSVPGSGKTKTPPTGATYMRVAIVGGGGGGSTGGYGSGGGGCAATKIVPASTITYTIGSGGTGNVSASSCTDGQNSTATFTGYSLVGGGGKKGVAPNAAGGTATGGDYNYAGGDQYPNSTSGGGAGSAGRGAGSGGYLVPGEYFATTKNMGWGFGGGGSGSSSGGGMGGSNAISGLSGPNMSAPGLPDASMTTAVTTVAANFGGGGNAANGGNGGILVEYFYNS